MKRSTLYSIGLVALLVTWSLAPWSPVLWTLATNHKAPSVQQSYKGLPQITPLESVTGDDAGDGQVATWNGQHWKGKTPSSSSVAIYGDCLSTKVDGGLNLDCVQASGTDAGTYTINAPIVVNDGTYTNHLGPVVTTGTDAGTMMTWLLPPGRTGLLDTYVLGQQVGDAGPNFGFAKWECGVGIFGRCQYSMPCMATQAWLASDAGVATGWSTAVSLTAIDGGGCAESVLVRSPGHTALWGGLSQFATVPSWPTNGAVPPVPGYDLWLDGTFSGNTATTWYDRSGNGYNATATSHGGGSMQLLPTDCYGRQCYRFSSTGGNGDQPYMVTAASWPLGSFTLFLVFRLTNPSASLNRPGGFATATDCTYLSVEPIYDNVTNAWPTGYVNHTSYGQPGSPLDNNMHIAAIAKAGDTYYDPWLDGVWVGTRSTGAPPSTTDSRTIGYTSNCGAEVMYGDMAEVIEYPFDLTLQQYKTVDEYLGVKWGVTVP